MWLGLKTGFDTAQLNKERKNVTFVNLFSDGEFRIFWGARFEGYYSIYRLNLCTNSLTITN